MSEKLGCFYPTNVGSTVTDLGRCLGRKIKVNLTLTFINVNLTLINNMYWFLHSSSLKVGILYKFKVISNKTNEQGIISKFCNLMNI